MSSGVQGGAAAEAQPPVLLAHVSDLDVRSVKIAGGKGAGGAAGEAADDDAGQSAGAAPPSCLLRLRAAILGVVTSPCQLWRFLTWMYGLFGGFVPVGALQYGVNQGLGMGLGGLAQRYFLKDVLGLAGNPALMQNIRTAGKIPWNIKPVMGMLSDAFPIFGYHRTSYMGFAAGAGVVAYVCLGSLPATALSSAATVGFLIFVNLSVATPDVMIDATAAKLSKEKPENASDLQSLVWGALPMGVLLSAAISGTIEEALGPQIMLVITAVCPLTILVCSLLRLLPEERLPRGQRGWNLTFLRAHGPVTFLALVMSAMSITLSVLSVTVESARARGFAILGCGVLLGLGVYLCLFRITPILAKTALFIFARDALQPNLGDPMFVWLTDAPDGPQFGAKLMGALEGVGAVSLFFGVVLYNKYLTRVSYRKILLFAQIALVLYNFSDLILVLRLNLKVGIPDEVFVAGDDAFGVLCGRFIMMPLFVLSSKVCPDHLEGTLFAMLMALSNFGSSIGDFFGSSLTEAFGIHDGNFDLLPQAVIAKSICRLLPIPLIFLLIPNLTPDDPIPGGAGGGDESNAAATEEGEAGEEGGTCAKNDSFRCNSNQAMEMGPEDIEQPAEAR